ncbi:MAG: hypothetical protein HY378_00040 [Candidatus Brennerbacteria bacterium]|nr:hypothetical protein [Candidatus Brennerbacteria bacterium]
MKRSLFFIIFFSALLFGVERAEAASLKLGPTVGTFTVGSTFDVSIFLDTEGETINALDASLSFPPDKLQIVLPTTGQSIISVWTSQPRFNNLAGTVSLRGGLPGGINVSSGLVTTLTFRVKSVGTAVLRFLDDSRVFLHDGKGTDALRDTQNGIYSLILPPPAGPIIVSETHPDQSRWYSNSSVVLNWAPDSEAGGYSYVLNEEPIGIPDDISEGAKANVVYRSVADGVNYFHVKALRGGVWGGSTHYALNVDTTPPADFKVQIIPGPRTTRTRPIIQFVTTDTLSGMDHYELKIIPLSFEASLEEALGGAFFIEAESPYIPPELRKGSYDVVVRAYDKAGNYRDVGEKLKITTAVFRFVQGEGLEVRGFVVVPWPWVWSALALAIVLLSGVAVWSRRRHLVYHMKLASKELPNHLKKKLVELNRYRKKYGKIAILLMGLIGLISLTGPVDAFAQNAELAPPLITSISRDISNEEIFYAGGKTDVTNASVVIYLQNLQTGETLSATVQSDRRGDWFYRHDGFLSTGNYLLWAQTRLADQTSPPSPQIQMSVRPTALQFGSSRVSYEVLYLILTVIFFLAVLGLSIYIVYHAYHSRRKYQRFWKETKEAEESVRRGFAVLRRDIQAELALVKKAKLGKPLQEEGKIREAELLKDLDSVERYIGKEIWDIEKAGHTD